MRVLSIDVGIRNLAYSILEMDDDSGKVVVDSWDTIDLFPSSSNSGNRHHHGMSDVCRALIRALNERIVFTVDMTDIQLVLIEDQPNYAGVTSVKAAQFYMQAFFENLGFCCGSQTGGITVRLVKPAIKTKMLDILPANVRSDAENAKVSKYRRTKMMASLVTREFLSKTDPALLEQFLLLKKPDVADTVCQALAYLKDHYGKARSVLTTL